jgi:hypothetical protein
MPVAAANRTTLAAFVAGVLTLLMLVGARPAPGDVVSPVVILGPTTVLNGVVTISGTLTAPNPSSAQLTVNGQPLSVNAAGLFSGTVNLGGQSEIVLSVQSPVTGETSTIRIPLTTNLVGPGGVISPDALAGLQQAALSLLKPVGGFVSIGDKPIVVSGSVGSKDQLASLSVNGIDALSLLRPTGGFTIPVAGTTKDISVLMTDKQGVSLKEVERVSAGSVSASEALGVRIASIRYFTKGVKTTKRLRMVVTIKDRRSLLVRGAVVKVRSAKTGKIVGRAKTKRTNKKGQASFVLRLRPTAFGKRFVVMTTASTPKAKASKKTSVRLPRLHRR